VSAKEVGADGSINPDLVGRLLVSQFPEWADLPLTRLRPAGSDNVIYRLGQHMSVRLPRGDWAAGQAAKEHYWLPRLAPRLPLPIPVPLGVGKPAFGYPWDWSVSRWLPGETATVRGLADPRRTASELAEFMTALQHALPVESDAPNPHDELTGVPLAKRDHSTRAAIAAVRDIFDARAMTAVWDAALAAPAWDRAPVWFHGDLHLGNLLVSSGQLSAVIDFAGLGAGDPACDMVIAWNLLSPQTRPIFRAALQVDDATWTRAQGWALTTGLNAYTSYAATNPLVAMNTRRQITQVLIDHAFSRSTGSPRPGIQAPHT
jgi:aminoglycoside phosphotransferase (APT) family kinase protein